MSKRTSYLLSHDLKDCCACRACEQICPEQCISMEEQDGFWYPQIAQERCIHCHRCEAVCQYTSKENPKEENSANKAYYAAWNRGKEALDSSTSGGIFIALAEAVLSQNGVVYGAVYTENFDVVIARGETLQACHKMQGSKYAKSDTRDSYTQVKEDLGKGKKVLYTGTPCQIAGLKRYLGKASENLFTVDIICHGTPSVLLLKSYIQKLEQDAKKKVSNLVFRRKKDGWKDPYVEIQYEDGSCRTEAYRTENQYAEVFGFGAATDPACSACLHTSMERESDLTIGDFWNIESVHPSFLNPDGTSVVLVNTEKGGALLNLAEKQLVCYAVSSEDARKSNPQLSVPSSLNPLVYKMIPYLKQNGFDKAYIRYVKWGKIQLLPYRVVRKVKKIIKK